MISHIAPVMHTARLFGTQSPEQAMAIMIKGYELGFSLSASFENIHVIKDKPSLSPKGALGMIYRSPEFSDIKINDEVDSKGVPTGCTVWMKRRNGQEYTVKFTMDDARRADLVKADSGWSKYPANMLRWRAIGYCEDILFPDVIGGTKRADEFGADLTPDGDVIDGSWSVQGSQQAPTAVINGTPTNTVGAQTTGGVSQSAPAMNPNRLQDLLTTYGAEKVMAANKGMIPGTNAELDAIEAVLNRELEITGGK